MPQICKHPVIAHNLNIMRKQTTAPSEFRRRLRQIAQMLVYEASRDLPQRSEQIETPMETMEAYFLTDPEVLLVSILRAGNGFLDGALEVFPEAKVGFLGMYRDEETLQPRPYYRNIPSDLKQKTVILLDPMLATGGSACDALGELLISGARDVRFVTLVAAPEGVAKVKAKMPDIKIFTASLDKGLNENGYILPGLGDAGDRIFNSF